jgi:tRNA pseudouridine38-40 synthase
MEGEGVEKGESQKSLKIKVGIFFGYNGEKFQGLQYQRDTENTIENIMHKVLCENGFVLKSNQDNLRRIKWSRAGRTDKKVHALCNGISASLEFDERYIIDREKRLIDFDRVIKDINAELPFDIRVFAVKKLGKSFDMRHDAFSRVYNYIAPLKLFFNREDFKNEKILNELEKDEILTKLNHLVTFYLGTHNYHNLTKGYKVNDPKCDRYMMSMKAELVEDEVVNSFL